jgi:hypothetical protein
MFEQTRGSEGAYVLVQRQLSCPITENATLKRMT